VAQDNDERMSQAASEQLSARLNESRDALMAAITGLDEATFRARTSAGDWTPGEVLTHLLAVERARLEQVRTVLAQDNAFVRWIDDEELDQQTRAAAQRMPVPQIVHGLLAQRRDVVDLLATLSQEQLERLYQHERRGEHTAGWLFQRMAEHEFEHAEQIRSLRNRRDPGP
jgi:hypothetical protein